MKRAPGEGAAVSRLSARDGAVEVELSAPVLTLGQEHLLRIRLDHGAGTFVFGEPIPDGYVATTVTVRAPEGLTVGAPKYPPTRPFAVEGIDDVFYVFEGEVAQIEVPLRADSAIAGVVPLEVEIHYQACDQRKCHLPRAVRLRLEVAVVE